MMMLKLSVHLTIACLIGAPCVLFVARLVGRAHGRISGRLQDFSAEAFNIAEETIQNIRTVRSFGNEEEELKRFEHVLQRSYRTSLIQAALSAAQKWFVEVSDRAADANPISMETDLIAVSSTLYEYRDVILRSKTGPRAKCHWARSLLIHYLSIDARRNSQCKSSMGRESL